MCASVEASAGDLFPTTLSIETVARRAGDVNPSPDQGPFAVVVVDRVVVQAESTGRTWTLDRCKGWCELGDLPPGRYRVTVQFEPGRVVTVTGVVVEANRQTYLRVEYANGYREVPASTLVASDQRGARVPGMFVAVPDPDDLPWPRQGACALESADGGARAGGWRGLRLRLTELGFVLTQPQFPLGASPRLPELWGDLRRWWGGFAGIARDPDGQVLGGVPVYLEFLDVDADRPVTMPPIRMRSTPEGCVGLDGLWPGRYRVTVDHPPLAFSAIIDIRRIGAPERTRHDLDLQVALRPGVPPTQRLAIESKGLGRVSSVDDLLRAYAHHPSRRGTAPAGANESANVGELTDVSGIVVPGQYDPDNSNWEYIAGIPFVRVTFKNESSGERTHVSTTADGSYSIRLPAGVYEVDVEHAPYLRLHARVLVTPWGHAVLEGHLDARASVSGVPNPGALLHSGLLAALNLALVFRPIETAASRTDTLTVTASSASYLAPPLSVEFTAERPEESLWTTPLTHTAVNGRTVQAFHPLVPGIVYTESTGTQAQFTSTGQRRFSNRLTVDGMSADLGFHIYGIREAGSGALPAYSTTGSTQTLVPSDAIEKVSIQTTNVPSEIARTPGAQTNIVTRAGGNSFSGLAFNDLRPEGLSATDFFDNANGRRRSHFMSNAGISLGGPLVPRTNYWVSYEGLHMDRTVETTTLVPSLAAREVAPPALRQLLDAFPQPNGPELSAEREELWGGGLADLSTRVPAASDLSVVGGRLDVNRSGDHRMFVRVNHGRSQGDLFDRWTQTPMLLYENQESTATDSLTTGVTWIGSSTVHDFRLNVTEHRGRVTNNTTTLGGAQALPDGVLAPPDATAEDTLIRLWVYPSDRGGTVLSGNRSSFRQRQLQLIDTWTLLRGRHEWKLGIDFRQVTTQNAPAANHYWYRFRNVPSLVEGRLWFAQLEHNTPARARIQTLATFVQDDFQVSPRLSLHYGLRYSVKPAPISLTDTDPLLLQFERLPDVQPRPDGSRLWRTSWTDIASRASASYLLKSDAGRETTLRAGWSLAFDEMTSPGLTAFSHGFPGRWFQGLPSSTFPVPIADLRVPPPATFEEARIADAYSFPDSMRSPRVHQWNVSIDQGLGLHQRVALAYVGSAARNLPYWHVYYPYGEQAHSVHAYSDNASADYNALLVEYVRRLSAGLQARIAYTWSHAIDTDSGELDVPRPPPSISPVSSNRGSADFDRRHLLYASASYQLPTPPLPKPLQPVFADWQIGVVGVFQSGAPVTVTYGHDFGGSIYYTVRPDVVPDQPMWLDDSSSPTGRRLNPDAFSVPAGPWPGDLGRNTLRSSPLRQIDLWLDRSCRLRGSLVARLRIDIFNVFNTRNFGPPWSMFTNDPFGVPYMSYAHALGSGTLEGGGLPPAQQVGGPRAIQVGIGFGW